MEPKSLPFNIDSSGHSGRQSVRYGGAHCTKHMPLRIFELNSSTQIRAENGLLAGQGCQIAASFHHIGEPKFTGETRIKKNRNQFASWLEKTDAILVVVKNHQDQANKTKK